MDLPLLRRLGWTSPALGNDQQAESALMARSALYLFVVSGTVALVTLAIPPYASDADRLGIAGVSLLCLGLGAVLVVGFERLSIATFQVILAAGTMLTSAGLYFGGNSPNGSEVFYLWTSLYAFYFFSRRQALLQLALVGVAYGGVLALQSDAGAPLSRWLMVMAVLATAGLLVALLKERTDRLIVRLTTAANTDALTCLLNRRGFVASFEAELERARRGEARVGLIVADVDRFKEVNDRLGHQAGDQALQAIADLLGERKRRIDVAARIGGEEFALVLPETDEHGAYMLAEQLRTALRARRLEPDVTLTASIGIASFPAHGETVEELLRAADEALYAAKELGRDRSVIHSAEMDQVLKEIAGRRDAQAEMQLATVLTLAEALDIRDTGTSRHSQTVARYAEAMAKELGLPVGRVERVRLAGVLHDVGKIGVPDAILRKPGPLTESEWAEMRKHPEIGARLLANEAFDDIRAWVIGHHERPDGKGYPYGLVAEQIPLEASILAVADAFEAMTADRVYRPSIGIEAALKELRRGAGTQFDASSVEAFLMSRSVDQELSSAPAH